MKYDMKDLVVKDCVYAFQSNNYNIEEHINYKNDLKEFIDVSQILKIEKECMNPGQTILNLNVFCSLFPKLSQIQRC